MKIRRPGLIAKKQLTVVTAELVDQASYHVGPIVYIAEKLALAAFF
jgi:hypothetical protein